MLEQFVGCWWYCWSLLLSGRFMQRKEEGKNQVELRKAEGRSSRGCYRIFKGCFTCQWHGLHIPMLCDQWLKWRDYYGII
jgi:hypothetical protein